MAWLCTARTINSRLWFVNNQKLENRILGYLAKYQEKYGAVIYAFTIQGNHYHLLAQFPNSNRAAFFRDFNARIAESVRYCVTQFEGGPLFDRRYTHQALPLAEDIKDYFFYCALQPVNAGLTRRISEYPGYNSFSDASKNSKREFKVISWGDYNSDKRHNPDIRIQNYTKIYQLSFTRLPKHSHLSQKAYAKDLLIELEDRRQRILKKQESDGHKSYCSKEMLEQIIPGSKPFTTKKGSRRPLVLSRCKKAKEAFLEWFFSILQRYWNASVRYLSGDTSVMFPPNTYKPPGPFVSEVST
jgi:REP element-mobilizing transposase RayT